MSTYISNRNSSGLTDENGHFRLPVKMVQGEILEGFTPTASGSTTITISKGEMLVPYLDYGYYAWSDANATVSISAADANNPRIDRVVAYIDRSMTFSASTTNHPNGLKFAVIKGTAAGSPTAPSDSAVSSGVSNNPWVEICRVRVNANVAGIYSNNLILDYRKPLRASDNLTIDHLTTPELGLVKLRIIRKGDPLPTANAGETLLVLETQN